MRLIRRWLVYAALGITLLLTTTRADALPSFSRKYHMACSGCHDAPVVPRLNDVGFKFRRAGFRMPETIGQEEVTDFNLSNYFSAHIALEYSVARTLDRTVDPSSSNLDNRLAVNEVSFHPLTGSFQKHWATETEIAFSPAEGVSIENAYIRGAWGGQDLWFESRVGAFHAIEGFGASDRPIGVSYPLFATQGAGRFQDTLFRLVEPTRVGAEAGVQWDNTSLSFFVVNGLTTVAREGEVVVTGVPTGGVTREELMVFANQILGPRSGMSAYWAHGSTRPPRDVAGFTAGTNLITWRNDYDRFALFGSVGVGWFTGLMGGEVGFDNSLDPTSGEVSRARSRSGGAFLEGDFTLAPDIALFTRLDYFDPAASASHNTQKGITLGTAFHTQWLYLIPELQYRSTLGNDLQSATMLLHAVAIY